MVAATAQRTEEQGPWAFLNRWLLEVRVSSPYTLSPRKTATPAPPGHSVHHRQDHSSITVSRPYLEFHMSSSSARICPGFSLTKRRITHKVIRHWANSAQKKNLMLFQNDLVDTQDPTTWLNHTDDNRHCLWKGLARNCLVLDPAVGV